MGVSTAQILVAPSKTNSEDNHIYPIWAISEPKPHFLFNKLELNPVSYCAL